MTGLAAAVRVVFTVAVSERSASEEYDRQKLVGLTDTGKALRSSSGRV